jgi:hypothetical protein
MRTFVRCFAIFIFALLLHAISNPAFAQSADSAGTILGIVTDASGAVISEATITIENPQLWY